VRGALRWGRGVQSRGAFVKSPNSHCENNHFCVLCLRKLCEPQLTSRCYSQEKRVAAARREALQAKVENALRRKQQADDETKAKRDAERQARTKQEDDRRQAEERKKKAAADAASFDDLRNRVDKQMGAGPSAADTADKWRSAAPPAAEARAPPSSHGIRGGGFSGGFRGAAGSDRPSGGFGGGSGGFRGGAGSDRPSGGFGGGSGGFRGGAGSDRPSGGFGGGSGGFRGGAGSDRPSGGFGGGSAGSGASRAPPKADGAGWRR